METAAVYSRWGFLLWLWFVWLKPFLSLLSLWQQSNRKPEYDRSKGLAGYDTIVLQDCAPGAPEFLAASPSFGSGQVELYCQERTADQILHP